MEFNSKWNVTQNGISLKIEFNLNEMSHKMESLKMECHSKLNVTPNGMSLKMKCRIK